MVPVRYLADALGAQTTWDDATKTVTITRDGTTIVMVVGSKALTVNGQTSQMDVAPAIQDSRTFLPARWVAEALGATVQYNPGAYTVLISIDGFNDFPAVYLKGVESN